MIKAMVGIAGSIAVVVTGFIFYFSKKYKN